MGWQNSNVVNDYTNWLSGLTANGGNFIRVWMASWAFGLVASPGLTTGDVLTALWTREFYICHKVLPCRVVNRQKPGEIQNRSEHYPFTAPPEGRVKLLPRSLLQR